MAARACFSPMISRKGNATATPEAPRNTVRLFRWKPWEGFHSFPRSGFGEASSPAPTRSSWKRFMDTSSFHQALGESRQGYVTEQQLLEAQGRATKARVDRID